VEGPGAIPDEAIAFLMIDLHSHTNFSDGTASPAELLKAARAAGLSALAITDHDTLAGFDVASPLAAGSGAELVCGIELTTQYRKGQERGPTMHVLGYFLREIPGEEFRRWLTSISVTRRDRNLELMAKLQASKIDISWNDFPGLGPEIAARPHFARVLVEKGYASDLQRAFDVYLSDPVLAGIERKVPTPQEAIDHIRRNGGISSLAHPGRLRCEPAVLRSFLDELIRSGLDAIEAYHSDHTPEETAWLLQMAGEFGVPVTGGSDFHGENKPDIRLGSGRNGNVQVADEVLARLKGYAAARIRSG
jgi:3',5'-nucleoside bisphosphate phosphatase